MSSGMTDDEEAGQRIASAEEQAHHAVTGTAIPAELQGDVIELLVVAQLFPCLDRAERALLSALRAARGDAKSPTHPQFLLQN
jgi:hypothetical protein